MCPGVLAAIKSSDFGSNLLKCPRGHYLLTGDRWAPNPYTVRKGGHLAPGAMSTATCLAMSGRVSGDMCLDTVDTEPVGAS